jgi:RNA polymerase sigma-70 factor (sigma-E family)
MRSLRVRATDDEFAEFAAAASGRLRRVAFMLCGDWHTAEDLAQTALAKVYVSWRKIKRRDAAQAYAARILLNVYLADKRTKRAGELLFSEPPDGLAPVPAADTRIVVLDALATLPPKSRAVVVLRYYEDLSVDQVAGLLGCSAGNVKSQTARALDKLRPLLGELAPLAGRSPEPNPDVVAVHSERGDRNE